MKIATGSFTEKKESEILMTYIDYLNEFNQWLESNTLPVNSQLMFFKLLNVFNRAGWPEHVRVDTLRLMTMIETTSEKTARRARDKLVETGWLSYTKGKKGSPNIYSLTSENRVKYTVNFTPENDPLIDPESDPICDPVCDPKSDPHIKTKNKTKTKSNPPLIPPQGETGFGPELQSAFEDWLAYKQEKRQGYKPTGLKSLITQIRNNAEKYGEQAVADLIGECMASNWQGIAFEKLRTKGGGKSSGSDTGHTESPWHIEQTVL